MANKLAHKADPFQQQAIDSMARGIRIVAPAGSGKSETLARRVAKQLVTSLGNLPLDPKAGQK